VAQLAELVGCTRDHLHGDVLALLDEHCRSSIHLHPTEVDDRCGGRVTVARGEQSIDLGAGFRHSGL
jgi:hypothetical protein